MTSITNLLIRFKHFDKGGSVSGTVVVNFASAGLSALSSVVFARLLGITNYGLYVYVISATGLVGGIATLGLPTFITRQSAAWAATEDWQQFNGIIRFGILASLISSGIFGILLFACSRFLGRISSTPGFAIAVSLGIGIMILQCLDTSIAGALQGMAFHCAKSFTTSRYSPCVASYLHAFGIYPSQAPRGHYAAISTTRHWPYFGALSATATTSPETFSMCW